MTHDTTHDMTHDTKTHDTSYLRVVILDGDDSPVAGGGVVLHGLDVQGLDGEGVHHADVDPGLLQDVGCLERLVQRHTGAHHQDLVRCIITIGRRTMFRTLFRRQTE